MFNNIWILNRNGELGSLSYCLNISDTCVG